MKLRFFIPVFALCFILSCGGDDPDEFMRNDDDTFASPDENDELPDGGNSGEENTTDDAEEHDGGNTETPDDNETPDSSVPDSDGTDTTPDDDADTSDTTDDEDGTNDDDSDTGDGSDTGSNDDDADSGSDTGEEDELEVVLPYNGGTVDKTMNFDTKIKKIDVMLLIDLYSSISAAHENIKTNVKTAIIDVIRAKISDSAFGLVKFGTFEKDVYVLAQPVTTDVNTFRNAVDTITSGTTGSRTYHHLALWEAASGEADYEQIAYKNSIGETSYMSINIPAVDCNGEEGTIGGGCFRENAMPVFVMASSRKFNDLSYDNFGEWKQGTKKTRPIAAAKMNEINAKFIGVSLTTSSTTNPLDDFKYIAEQTKSQTTNGGNFNVSTNADNSTLSQQIAEAVKSLTDNIQLSVQAGFKHVDNEYGVENTVDFVKSFYPSAAQTVKAGTQASLEITFENDFHENNDCEPHVFRITAEAVGEGITLDSRTVKIIVPGKSEEECDSL